jgi:hypothetical protein
MIDDARNHEREDLKVGLDVLWFQQQRQSTIWSI